MYTVTEAANRLGVHPNTVRNLSASWRDFLSPGANPPRGTARRFTDQDVAVLLAIVGAQQERLPRDAIVAMLQHPPTPYIDAPVLADVEPAIIQQAPTPNNADLAELMAVTSARLDRIERNFAGVLLGVAILAIMAFAAGGLFVLAVLAWASR